MKQTLVNPKPDLDPDPEIIRICHICNSNNTYIHRSKKGTPVSNWHYHKGKLICSRCHSSNYKKANRSKIKAYREKNRDRIRQYYKMYNIKNRDRLRQQRLLRYRRNREEILRKRRIYRASKRDVINERQRKRRVALKTSK
jgi:hypothetical protein